MDPITIALISLRSFATLFVLQGKPQVADAFNAVANATEAGRNVDAHMQELADTLKAGGALADWKDLTRRANDETTAFLDQNTTTI